MESHEINAMREEMRANAQRQLRMTAAAALAFCAAVVYVAGKGWTRGPSLGGSLIAQLRFDELVLLATRFEEFAVHVVEVCRTCPIPELDDALNYRGVPAFPAATISGISPKCALRTLMRRAGLLRTGVADARDVEVAE